MKKISEIAFDNMGEKHTFPNGMVVIIEYGETNDFGDWSQICGKIRRTQLLDENNNLITELIEKNPYFHQQEYDEVKEKFESM